MSEKSGWIKSVRRYLSWYEVCEIWYFEMLLVLVCWEKRGGG